MNLTFRNYLFANDGLYRLSKRIIEGLLDGTEALPQYAATKVRAAEVTLNNDGRFPIEIVGAKGSYLEFDSEGKIDRRDLALIAFDALSTHDAVKKSRSGAVVDLGPSIERQQWERENRWTLSKEDLDLIATDIWGPLPEGAKRKSVKGTGPRPPPLTYQAKEALKEIERAIAQIDFQICQLSEAALKGIAFRARQKARDGRDDVVWNGVASLADYCSDVQARHRRGNGKWFAVIEAWTSYPEEKRSSVACVAFKECNSKREVEEAARILLAENAKHFSESTSIEAKLYCDLQWSPDDREVYVWPAARARAKGEDPLEFPDWMTDEEETADDEDA